MVCVIDHRVTTLVRRNSEHERTSANERCKKLHATSDQRTVVTLYYLPQVEMVDVYDWLLLGSYAMQLITFLTLVYLMCKWNGIRHTSISNHFGSDTKRKLDMSHLLNEHKVIVEFTAVNEKSLHRTIEQISFCTNLRYTCDFPPEAVKLRLPVKTWAYKISSYKGRPYLYLTHALPVEYLSADGASLGQFQISLSQNLTDVAWNVMPSLFRSGMIGVCTVRLIKHVNSVPVAPTVETAIDEQALSSFVYTPAIVEATTEL